MAAILPPLNRLHAQMNASDSDGALENIASVIGGRWKLILIYRLYGWPQRFTDLEGIEAEREFNGFPLCPHMMRGKTGDESTNLCFLNGLDIIQVHRTIGEEAVSLIEPHLGWNRANYCSDGSNSERGKDRDGGRPC